MKMQNINKELKEITEIFNAGMENILKAGEKLAKLIDTGVTKDEIMAGTTIPERILESLERIGRHEMDYRLLIGGGPNRLQLRRLNISDQKRILDGDKLTLVLGNGDTILVNACECDKEQAKQLFSGAHIRNEGEQRAYLEARKTDSSIELNRIIKNHEVNRNRWCVKDGVCYVTSGALSKADLKAIMQEVM